MLIWTVYWLQSLLVFSTIGGEANSLDSRWLNTRYIECLEDKLPCACEQLTETYYSVSIHAAPNGNAGQIALAMYSQNEPYSYSFIKTEAADYTILSSSSDSVGWASFRIKNDTLEFMGKNSSSKFSRTTTLLREDHPTSENVRYLNQALAKRGHPTLEKILGSSYLRCTCNKWMENTNVLYVKNTARSWIVEIAEDSLHLNTILNTHSDPDAPVLTKKLISYRWPSID